MASNSVMALRNQVRLAEAETSSPDAEREAAIQDLLRTTPLLKSAWQHLVNAREMTKARTWRPGYPGQQGLVTARGTEEAEAEQAMDVWRSVCDLMKALLPEDAK